MPLLFFNQFHMPAAVPGNHENGGQECPLSIISNAELRLDPGIAGIRAVKPPRSSALVTPAAILVAVAWCLVLDHAIPAAPYLDYDEAIHAGAGMIVYDYCCDVLHGSSYAERAYRHFNAGLIYWPFLHGLLLGLAYAIAGLSVSTALVFSISIGAGVLVLLFILARRRFGLTAACLGCSLLAIYRPFIIATRTVMLDMLQFAFVIMLLNVFLKISMTPENAEIKHYQVVRTTIVSILLSFTRITGWFIHAGCLALLFAIAAIRSRSLRCWNRQSWQRLAAPLLVSGLLLACFYGSVYLILDYNVITAYRAQQQETFFKVWFKDLPVYPKIIAETFHGGWWAPIVCLSIMIAGWLSPRPQTRYLAWFLTMVLAAFQMVRLKEIRFLLPWYGFLWLLGAVVIFERAARLHRAIRGAAALALLAGFIAAHVNPHHLERKRNTSGMQAAVSAALAVMAPGQTVLVRSYAADYYFSIEDRPSRITDVNCFNAGSPNFTPDFALVEENSQLDYPPEIKRYFSDSGRFELLNEFPGDEAVKLYRRIH